MNRLKLTAVVHPVSTDRLEPVAGHVAVSLKKLMLVWGGYHTTEQGYERYNSPDQLLVYDTELDKWFRFSTTGEIPPNTTGSCGIVVGTTLYIFGGFSGQIYDYARLYALDLAKLTWKEIKSATDEVPSGRHKLVGWHYKNRLYFFGGFGPPPYPSLFERDGLHWLVSNFSQFVDDASLSYMSSWNNQLISFDLERSVWEVHPLLGNAPSARAAHSCVMIPETESVIIFGGRLQDERMNDMYTLDLPSMVWTKIETNPGPCGRSWHSTVAVNPNIVILVGGFSQDCTPLSDMWLYNIEHQRWTELKRKSVVKPRLWHTAVAIDGTCYVFGGCGSNILAITGERREFWNDLVVIPTVPKPLFRLSLQYVYDHRKAYEPRALRMPWVVFEKLKLMASKEYQLSMKTPLYLLQL